MTALDIPHPEVGNHMQEVLASEQEALRKVTEIIDANLQVMGLCDDDLSQGPDGIYIAPEFVDKTETSIEHVELLPEATRVGAGDSHHEVMFSKVSVSDPQGQAKDMDVALKTFSTESGQALYEMVALSEVKRRGFDTLEPLAVVKHGEDSVLVTRRRTDLITLDNLPWNISPSDPERYEAELVPALAFAADVAAQLHAKGIFSGDFVPKNIARNDRDGFTIIDLESAIISRDDEDTLDLINGWGDVTQGKAFADITHFWRFHVSPLGDNPNVFLEDETSEVVVQEFEQRFLNPYIEALKKHLGPEASKEVAFDALRIAAVEFLAARV